LDDARAAASVAAAVDEAGVTAQDKDARTGDAGTEARTTGKGTVPALAGLAAEGVALAAETRCATNPKP
jgi:hypothetical protein